jgi:hypothetical protein
VLRDAGLSDAELARACGSGAYRTLLARLREGELRGFDVGKDLSTLVTHRPFEDAEDLAATLTHRVDRYVNAMGYPELDGNHLVAGLFPRATRITEPDVTAALRDRVDAIEERARSLATAAIKRGDAWVRDFGPAPATAERYSLWYEEVCAGAAYLDRWGFKDFAAVDHNVLRPQQESERDRVLGATERAGGLRREIDSRGSSTYEPLIDESFELAK